MFCFRLCMDIDSRATLTGDGLDPIPIPNVLGCIAGAGFAVCVVIGEVRTAMNAFTTSSGSVARMGLTIFPTKSSMDQCGPSVGGDVLVPIMVPSDSNADLQAQATVVNNQIQMVMPTGGTPTRWTGSARR